MGDIETLLQWSGAGFGIASTLLLALNLGRVASGIAFIGYSISSAFLVAWALMENANGILTMQLVYLVLNSIGVYRWLIRPAKPGDAAPTT